MIFRQPSKAGGYGSDRLGLSGKPVVPFIKATQDRVVLEIQRGCIRGCRFCQAGMIYRPNREKGVKRLKELAQTMLASTGYEEISLSSLSSSDYSDLEELINFLIEECDKNMSIFPCHPFVLMPFPLILCRKCRTSKKQSDICPGGRFPEIAKCHQ